MSALGDFREAPLGTSNGSFGPPIPLSAGTQIDQCYVVYERSVINKTWSTDLTKHTLHGATRAQVTRNHENAQTPRCEIGFVRKKHQTSPLLRNAI